MVGFLANTRDKRGRLVCWCTGYWFPHRRGGGACYHGTRSDYYLAKRQGVTESDAQALLWAHVLERLIPVADTQQEVDDRVPFATVCTSSTTQEQHR